ncbi:MAG: PTS sugar transporter subunit IIA [SAR324 cluster bacterium]|nr:PTS sugar transporter subunit IIA [SAR324 cluster bacterium]
MEITLLEAAQLLQIQESTIRRWVRQGSIPCTYRSGRYVFNSKTLKTWAELKQIHLRDHQKETTDPKTGQTVDLIEALTLGGTYYHVKAGNKQELFQEVELLFALPSTNISLADQLSQREILAPTSIGRGIAIPHPQYPTNWGLGAPAVGTFFLESPLDFGAIDEIPIFVLFVLLSPSSQIHLQLLSQLAQILRNDAMSEFLSQQPTFEALVSQFKEILGKKNS